MIIETAVTLLQIWHEVELTAAAGTFLWVIMYPIRTLLDRVKRKADLIDEIHTELSTQRTNCLATLQGQGTRQIELLEKMNDGLSGLHDAAVETNTILKMKK